MEWLLNPPVTYVLLSVFLTRNAVQALRKSLSPVHNNWQLTYHIFFVPVHSQVILGQSYIKLLGKMKEQFMHFQTPDTISTRTRNIKVELL